MKRVLAILSLVCALFVAAACHYDISLSVDASADLSYFGKSVPTHIAPSTYTGFHRNSLSDDDLEWIFTNLIKEADPDFQTAIMHLDIYDEIGGGFLRSENYGVVFNSHTGHYDFADMDIVYK